MFEARLKLLLIGAGAVAIVFVVRLFELQVVRGAHYRERAAASVMLRPQPLPFVRGRILDRTGEVLVSDRACWDVRIDFGVIAADVTGTSKHLKRSLRRWQRDGFLPRSSDVAGVTPGQLKAAQLTASLRESITRMWYDLALLTADSNPVAVSEFRRRARETYDRVMRIRKLVARNRGFDSPVAEENDAHAILSGLGSGEQIEARERLAAYPWVHVVPSSRRVFADDGEAFAHTIGRVGRVDREAIESDPHAEEPLAKYVANETLGVSGVEEAAEPILRGRRGKLVLDRNGAIVADELIEAQDGRDASLTIHAGLQRRLYRLLGETVRGVADSSGGAIVVVDVATREVLALVNYPSFDPNRFDEVYARLRDDTARLPLWPRAVATGYAPGSIVKPLVCLQGLMSGVISLDSTEHCSGYLFDDVRNRWRCWRVHGSTMRKAHGDVNVVEALTGSCNIFMYRLGEKLGVDRLCNAFQMAGIGEYSGIGLPEEIGGINPTPSWLMQRRNTRITPGKARHFAVGQGEILVTPVQAANLLATYAGGERRSMTLIQGAEAEMVWRVPARREDWLAIRRGMYGVVNDPTGTAYRTARFENDRYALCGKTGSASAPRRVTGYRIVFEDDRGQEHVERIPAGSRGDAMDRLLAAHPRAIFDPGDIEVANRWPVLPPPPGDYYSHAWFGGFLQPLDSAGDPDWSAPSPIAFAVLVEYGGSGGRTSGPLARAICAELLAVLGPNLDPDSRG